MKYLFLLMALAACGGPQNPTAVNPSGGMLGLDVEPDLAPWRSAEVVAMTERPPLDGWVVFDARGVKDPATRELTWQSINAIFTGFSDPAMRMVQAELEPADDVDWDVYFLVNQAAHREGVLWRMSRSASPGELVLNVLVERPAGLGADRVSLWVSTGVSAPSPTSLRYEKAETCQTLYAAGLTTPTAKIDDETCELAYSLLVTLLFTNVSGARYLEDPDVDTPIHHVQEELERRDRKIDEVFSDSAFPPRWTR